MAKVLCVGPQAFRDSAKNYGIIYLSRNSIFARYDPPTFFFFFRELLVPGNDSSGFNLIVCIFIKARTW